MTGKPRIDGVAFLASFIVLVMVIPYTVFSYFQEVDVTTELVACAAILFYSATRLAVLAGQGRPRLLAITFFVFIYIWVGLAATAQLCADQFPWEVKHKEEDVLPGIGEIWLAIAAFEFGYLWFRLRPASENAGAMFRGLSLAISNKAVFGLGAVATVLTLFGMVKFGFGNLLLTRAAMDAAVGQMGGSLAESLITRAFLRTPSLIAFTVIAYNGLRRWRTLDRRWKQRYVVLGTFMFGLYFVANYPPGQTRFWLGAVIFTPAFALPRWRRWFAPLWVLGLAAGLTVAFPYLDLFRKAATVSEAFDQLNVNEDMTKKMIQKADYDVFQMTLDGYRWADRGEGATMGDNLIGAALFWFPRSLWSGKPEGTGLTVAKDLGRMWTNLSAPLWMEFYYAFGWVGIGGLMLLYGRLCAWGEFLYARSLLPGAPDSLARLMVPYWAAFHMYLLRGDLMNATAYSAFGYLMLLATAIAPRIWGRNPPAAPVFDPRRSVSRR